MKTIEVSAAVIAADEWVLATQRGYGAYRGWWEFPGGKLEAGETPESALIREIREELETELTVLRKIQTVEYDYPEFHLKMHCYLCRISSGTPVLKEHEAARWLKADRLREVQWLPADEQILGAVSAALMKASGERE